MRNIVLIVHNIRSTHNVGAILRTAEGLGVRHCYFTGYTPYPMAHNDTRLPHIATKLDGAIHKTALGAEKLIPFTVVEDVTECVDQLHESGYLVVGLEQDERSIPIHTFDHDGDIALLLGEEVNGIDDSLRQRCDYLLEIPMVGKKESFNVSVATGIALYELTRPKHL